MIQAKHPRKWPRRPAVAAGALAIVVLCAPALLARQVSITILHTTDLHGTIWPTSDYDGNADRGGFLRCAATIQAIRSTNENVVVIDCGDTFQGSPENYLAKGRLLIDGMNAMKYDAWVLGNHEFDWGPEALRALHDRAQTPFLAANLYFMPGVESWLPGVRPYVIKEISGVRIAIIGLVTPGVPRWSRPQLLNGALFRRSVETLQAVMPAVKAEEPDVIVVAAHQGHRSRGDDFANEIQAIAKAFPEIDVLLGGHTHTAIEEMRLGNVLYTQAGYHGIWLGEVGVTYDTVSRSVVSKSSTLHLMDKDVPFHQGLMDEWADELNRASNLLDRVVGHLDEPLSSKPDSHASSSMQKFICRAIAEGTGADIVLHGSLAEEPVAAGTVTYRDVWKIVPYENTIGLISVTPAEIRDILAESFARPLTHQSLGAYGCLFDLERTARGPQVSNLRDGEGLPLHPRKRYKVALNSYVLASGGERNLRAREIAELPESRLIMLDIDTRELVMRYLKQHDNPAESDQSSRSVIGAEVTHGAE